MRKINILGAAFLAVLAFGTVVAASASATQWLHNGEEVTGKEPATTHGTLILHHVKGTFGSSLIECSGLFVGTIGPGVEDLVSLVENLTGSEKDLVKCITLEGSCSEPVIHADKLPWKTTLLLEESGLVWDDFSEDGKGAPGWLVLCKSIIGTIEVLCEGNVKAHFEGNGTNGAKFKYKGTESGVATCSDGGEGFLLGEGEVLGFTVS